MWVVEPSVRPNEKYQRLLCKVAAVQDKARLDRIGGRASLVPTGVNSLRSLL